MIIITSLFSHFIFRAIKWYFNLSVLLSSFKDIKDKFQVFIKTSDAVSLECLMQ